MKIDSIKYLTPKQEIKPKREPFTFAWFANEIIERQKQDKDTIIVVTGERRNGKSNWALKLILKFIRQKKREDPNFKWKWKDNFPLTRSQAIENVENVQDGSFICYDEGADMMYRSDTLSMMNKNLIKFMAKTGKKRLLTIIVLPDIYMLDTKILNMAHFLVTVPYRYKNLCSFAFIFGRANNPFISDKFALEPIKRQFQGKKVRVGVRTAQMTGRMKIKNKLGEQPEFIEIPYPIELFTFLRRIPTFLVWHRFKAVNPSFETAYKKNVKDKQLSYNADFNFIKESDYIKLRNKYEALLFNLYFKQQLSYAQLERLHRDNTGFILSSGTNIKKVIERRIAINEGKTEVVEDDGRT